MTVAPFVEDTVQGALDTLSSCLPAELLAATAKYAAKDAGRGETIPLPAPVSYVFGRHGNEGYGKPVIFAYADDTDRIAAGQVNGTTSWAEYSVRLTVECCLESDDVAALDRRYSRYGEAIYAVLTLHQDLGGVAVSTNLRRLSHEKSKNDLTTGVLWECQVEIQPQQ